MELPDFSKNKQFQQLRKDMGIKPSPDISIVDDGTLDTVVECCGEWFRYDSEYRFSFDNDAAFLDAIREEVLERLEEGVSIAPGASRKKRWIRNQGGTV